MERLPGVRKIMGSIPVGDSDFFFVSHSCHVDQFTFHMVKIFTCPLNVVLEPFLQANISTYLVPITTIKGHGQRGFSFFNRLGINRVIDLPLRLFTISLRQVNICLINT